MSYELTFPGRIVFGVGTARKLGEYLPDVPTLLVAGRHASDFLKREIVPVLSPRTCAIFDRVHAEPPLPDVEDALSLGRSIGAKAVVGIGGGSAVDTAKTVAALLAAPGTVAEYFYGKRKLAERRGIFFAALPTTAGTGAEITSNAVLIDPETRLKQSVRHRSMAADLALVDPELTYDCPPAVTAASGFDALTQALESYISKKATVPSRALAGAAAKQIYPALAGAFAGDRACRSAMSEGCMLGAMAFAQSGLGAVHGIGHPTGSLLGVSHGMTCAILLPEILEWNLSCCRERMTELAGMLEESSPENLIAGLRKLRQRLGLPENFRNFGLNSSHFAFIVKNCRSGSMKANPRDLSDEEVTRILETLA